MIGSITILACRDTLAAAVLTRYAGLHPTLPGDADSLVDPAAIPTGVRAMEWTALPRLAREIEGEHIPRLHQHAIGEAWLCGAWDVEVTLHPPMTGADQGLLTANADWSATPAGLLPMLIRAAEGGRLATWHWRPMAGGPAIRLKANLAGDLTLQPNGGRAGEPPPLSKPDWRWRGGRSWNIKLGRAADQPVRRPSPAAPRATGRQRRYIVALRHKLGRAGEPLPASLTRREASQIIDTLLKEAAHG